MKPASLNQVAGQTPGSKNPTSWIPKLRQPEEVGKFRKIEAKLFAAHTTFIETERQIRKLNSGNLYRVKQMGDWMERLVEMMAENEFDLWVENTRIFSRSTAFNCRRVAKEWHSKIEPALKKNADLTYKEAVNEVLINSRREKQADTTDPKEDLIERLIRWVNTWPAPRAERLRHCQKLIPKLENTAKKLNFRLRSTMPEVKPPKSTAPKRLDARGGQIIKRTALLQMLEGLTPGLSPREFTEQSSHFVFRDGEVATFNEFIACRQKIGLAISGAVDAAPLLKFLRTSNEREIAVRTESGKLILSGQSMTAQLPLAEDQSPIDDAVEKSGEWKEIGPEFIDAIARAIPLVSEDETKFPITCIHLHPDFIEATDNEQMIRVRVDTGLAEPLLLRGRSFLPMTKMGLVRMSITAKWIHLRNRTGFSCSYEKHKEPYPDLNPLLETNGHLCAFPKNLVSICQQSATILGADQDWITVAMQRNKMTLKAAGKNGEFEESTPIQYDGPAFEFIIDPAILQRIADNYSIVEITANLLKAAGENWAYVARLGRFDLEKSEEGA